ncbi:hypothetical protein GUB99_28100, partial [Escherichia coli]|nr:hypothetical protein [Escherichia coli]
MSWSHYR